MYAQHELVTCSLARSTQHVRWRGARVTRDGHLSGVSKVDTVSKVNFDTGVSHLTFAEGYNATSKST